MAYTCNLTQRLESRQDSSSRLAWTYRDPISKNQHNDNITLIFISENNMFWRWGLTLKLRPSLLTYDSPPGLGPRGLGSQAKATCLASSYFLSRLVPLKLIKTLRPVLTVFIHSAMTELAAHAQLLVCHMADLKQHGSTFSLPHSYSFPALGFFF